MCGFLSCDLICEKIIKLFNIVVKKLVKNGFFCLLIDFWDLDRIELLKLV